MIIHILNYWFQIVQPVLGEACVIAKSTLCVYRSTPKLRAIKMAPYKKKSKNVLVKTVYPFAAIFLIRLCLTSRWSKKIPVHQSIILNKLPIVKFHFLKSLMVQEQILQNQICFGFVVVWIYFFHRSPLLIRYNPPWKLLELTPDEVLNPLLYPKKHK